MPAVAGDLDDFLFRYFFAMIAAEFCIACNGAIASVVFTICVVHFFSLF